MKRALTSFVMIGLIIINFITTNFNNLVNFNTLNLEPQNQFYKLLETESLGLLIDSQATYQNGLTATVYIDQVGVARATINLIDSNYKLVNQYIFQQDVYPKLNLGSFGILNHSNAIVVDNKIIFYYHSDDTSDSSSRHKLVVVDITNQSSPILHLVNLELVGTNKSGNIFSKLYYVNNALYLYNEDNSDFTYVVAEINYDLTNNHAIVGYKSGSLTYLVSSSSTIIGVGNNAVLDFCYKISNNIYCVDKNFADSVYTIDSAGTDIDQTFLEQHNYLVGKKTTNGITQIKVYKYEISSNSVDINLKKEIVVESAEIRLVQINYETNKLIVIAGTKKYLIDLINLNDNVVESFVSKFLNQDILYNQIGKKLTVYSDETKVYATSDFDNRTYEINNFGYQVLAYSYYQDELLFLGYDDSNERYHYYKYEINFSNQNLNPISYLSFTKDDLRVILNQIYNGDYTYANTSNIDPASFLFYRGELIVIDLGTMSTRGFVNIINFPTNSINTYKGYYYDLEAGVDLDNLVIYYTFYLDNKTSDTDTFNLVAYGIYDGLNSIYSFIFDKSNSNGVGTVVAFEFNDVNNYLASFNQGSINYTYSLDVAKYELVITTNDGANINAIEVAIPKTALKALVNPSYAGLYYDFTTDFPYIFITFFLDEFNNLYIKDYLNNIHILYNPNLKTSISASKVVVGGQEVDSNALTHDLAVINTYSSILIEIETYFKRVFVNNSSPFNLNEGQNVISITLQSLNNTIKTLTFNVFRAPSLPQVSSNPPIVLPGLDPNYVPPATSSSSVPPISSSISSSGVSSSISSSSVVSSSSSSSSSSNSVISSVSSSISCSSNNSSVSSSVITDETTNNQDNPWFIAFLVGLPALLTLGLFGYSQFMKKKQKLAPVAQPTADTSKPSEPENK